MSDPPCAYWYPPAVPANQHHRLDVPRPAGKVAGAATFRRRPARPGSPCQLTPEPRDDTGVPGARPGQHNGGGRLPGPDGFRGVLAAA
jgi:hypothetical protein